MEKSVKVNKNKVLQKQFKADLFMSHFINELMLTNHLNIFGILMAYSFIQ